MRLSKNPLIKPTMLVARGVPSVAFFMTTGFSYWLVPSLSVTIVSREEFISGLTVITCLAAVVLLQANFLALFGFVPGLLASLGLYEVTRYFAGIPIGMNLVRAVAVLGLSVLMCSLSGLLCVRVVTKADPADLF